MDSTSPRERHKYDWTPQNIALLGTMTDQAVADRIGGKADAIREKRLALGIKAFKPASSPVKGKPRPNFNWTEQAISLLGTKPDKQVAQELGLATTTVALKRRSLGIGGLKSRRPPIKLPANLRRQLGKSSDAFIASKMGVSTSAVSRYRRRLGIEPFMEHNQLSPEADELLGKVSDRQIGQQFGVSTNWVRERRIKLGIQVAQPGNVSPPTTATTTLPTSM
ncbi:hypothetical protein F2S72_08920 [Pseudomonas syringae pv. actinidiae]|nr:hypothetical protein [Pseudomonas syringae pv. actinidiae]